MTAEKPNKVNRDCIENETDEHLWRDTLEESKHIAVEIGIKCDLSNKSERQVRGYIAKCYEGIITDLKKLTKRL